MKRHTSSKRLQVEFEFNNRKKLLRKLTRLEIKLSFPLQDVCTVNSKDLFQPQSDNLTLVTWGKFSLRGAIFGHNLGQNGPYIKDNFSPL